MSKAELLLFCPESTGFHHLLHFYKWQVHFSKRASFIPSSFSLMSYIYPIHQEILQSISRIQPPSYHSHCYILCKSPPPQDTTVVASWPVALLLAWAPNSSLHIYQPQSLSLLKCELDHARILQESPSPNVFYHTLSKTQILLRPITL